MSKKFLMLMLCCSLTFVFISCSEEEEGLVDPESAAAKIEEANEALEDVLYELINADSVSHPEEIDFSAPNQLYKEALELDADNLDANFGAGLTEMLTIFVDPQVIQTFDQWEAFIDTATFFEPAGGGLAKNLQNPGELFSISPLLLGVTSAGVFKMALTDPPLISSIQDLIESEVFPRVNYAIGKLEIVAANAEYTFIVTPIMQGDETEDPVEIDLTEIYAALAELYAIKAAGSIFISYDFDFVSYDSAGLHEAIQQNSSFLGLRTNGAVNMANAKASFLTAVDKIELAINFLKSETDLQDDDLIKIGSDDINEADLDSILAHLPDVRDAMNTSVDITEDFNGDGVDQTVAFAMGAIFDDPILNIKQKLPPYTSYVQRDSSYNGWEYEYFYAGIITWDAETFSEWIFPDATFNGLFPEITDDAAFKATFGINEADWERVVDLGFD